MTAHGARVQTGSPLAVALALAGALVAHGRAARAQFDPWQLELHWSVSPAVAAQCPDEPAVGARIEALLGHPALSGTGERLVARAEVTRSDAGVLSVQLATDHAGDVHRRTTEGTDCNALADATALRLAILVDPAAAAIRAPVAPVTPVQPAAPVVPVPPPLPVPRPPVAAVEPAPLPPVRIDRPQPRRIRSTAPPRRVRFVVRADALADVGTLPSLAAGGAIALGVRIDRVHVLLGAQYFFRQRKLLGTAATSLGGDFEMAAGTLTGCYDIARNPQLAFEGCALGEAGVLAGTGVNVGESLAGNGPWLAFGPAVAGVWRPVPWFGLRAQLGAMVPVFRPPYVYELSGSSTPTQVHQAGPVEARGALGVELNF